MTTLTPADATTAEPYPHVRAEPAGDGWVLRIEHAADHVQVDPLPAGWTEQWATEMAAALTARLRATAPAP